MNLTEFLLARIAEDEEWARNASRVRETRTGDSWTVGRGRYGLNKLTRPGGEVGEVLVEAAPHIARHDPARILAECEAKRRIVEAVQYLAGLPEGLAMPDRESAMGLERAMQAMGAVYADHPDYDPSWRP